ncbi:DUF928 domain-containing protein [Phormidesmis sp. 146-12]
MTRKTMTRNLLRKMILIGAIVPCLLSEFALAVPSATTTLSAKPGTVNQRRSRFNRIDFSDVGRPRKRRGGGSRGACSVPNKPPMTALMPDTSTGLTLAKSPTFWFFVPYTLTSDYLVEFVLKDNQDKTVYTNKAVGKGTSAGIVNLRLPSTVALEAGKDYHWYYLVYCDAQNQDKFVYVNGAIRRVERPDLERKLATAAPGDRVAHYEAEGIWHETLTEHAERLSASPQDTKTRQDWVSLLQSVGLGEVASAPLVL